MKGRIKDRSIGGYTFETSSPCVILNNIQQLRLQLEKVFASMGGESMAQEAQEVLREEQLSLNSMLDSLCLYFCQGFEVKIKKCMMVMASILHSDISDPKNDSVEAADKILSPLLAKLDPLLEFFLMICEKTVLKRILKGFWTLVIEQLEKIVILPRKQGLGLGNILGNTGAHELVAKVEQFSSRVQTITSELANNQTDTANIEAIAAAAGNKDDDLKGVKIAANKIAQPLSPKQCDIIKIVIANLKQYFYNEGFGLKKAHINKSEELASLENALAMYNKSCQDLITLFITTQKDQSMVREGDYESYGELNLQLELKKQGPKACLSVRLLNAVNLKVPTGSFKPYVEIILTGPKLAGIKHRYATKSKYGSNNPKFNETFQFLFGTQECPLAYYEVQFYIKDYCLFRDDKIVGLGVIQMSEILAFKQQAAQQNGNINATSVVGTGSINVIKTADSGEGSMSGDHGAPNCVDSGMFKSKSFQMLPNGFITCKLNLLKRIFVDESGWTILRILGQRVAQDPMAREFLSLKSATRNEP